MDVRAAKMKQLLGRPMKGRRNRCAGGNNASICEGRNPGQMFPTVGQGEAVARYNRPVRR